MDRITERYVTEFSAEYHLEELNDAERFEHFAAFSVIKQHHNIHFDTDEVVTGDQQRNQNGNDGGGTDTGIDAVAIIVNGTLITDPESLTHYESDSSSLDVQFVLFRRREVLILAPLRSAHLVLE